eukprot:CAMPEP_0174728226 /NCGR_PEP_ID=MMETSP1094-20130205/51344_1 /TAXON_ID=156173 /ORGANISM="Chrysochromulina brevifilum, Strain UTEX LB 985" /LENGTH=204 /DNA_ID=CAMNT_0015930105 /DNA_START=144 /DNA_END=755 /DNA_ORIENTATION=+
MTILIHHTSDALLSQPQDSAPTGGDGSQTSTFWETFKKPQVFTWLLRSAPSGPEEDVNEAASRDPAICERADSPTSMSSGSGDSLDDNVTRGSRGSPSSSDEAPTSETSGIASMSTTTTLHSIAYFAPSSSTTQLPRPSLAPPLYNCMECNEAITGAVFMLQDRAYCSQRHRLAAYHKSERSNHDCCRVRDHQGQGLRAIYGSW